MEESEIEKMARLEGTYWWFVGRRFLIGRLIDRFAGPSDPLRLILDLGCGTGGNLSLLRQRGQVVGLDSSLTALRYAHKKGVAPLIQADGHCLPFRDGVFDWIAVLDVLEHMDDDRAALKEMARVLKPGGRLILTVPAFMCLWSGHDMALGHRRRYLMGPLCRLLASAGLRVLLMRYCIIPVFPAVFLFRKIQNLFQRGNRPSTALVQLPFFLNRLLIALLEVEALLLPLLKLPFGVSLVAVCERERKAA